MVYRMVYGLWFMEDTYKLASKLHVLAEVRAVARYRVSTSQG